MVRRTLLLLTTIVVGVLISCGVALAANLISCNGGLCEGTTGDDEMIGTSSNDSIYAKEGNDILRGGRSLDDLRGGPGNDDLDGGRGNDQYNVYDNNWGSDRISGDGGGAEDWLIFQISAGALTIDLTPKSGQPEVSSDANTINFARDVVIEWVQAGPDKDIIKGNSADNYLLGGNDDDTLIGRKGDDHLVGDIVVFSNEGNDTLKGVLATTSSAEARAGTTSTAVEATTISWTVTAEACPRKLMTSTMSSAARAMTPSTYRTETTTT